MKYLVKFFVITFLIFNCTSLQANDSKIYFIDLKVVLNESKPGKEAQEFLKKKANDNMNKFKKIEETLKKKETDLIAKKNDTDKDEYKKMADALRKEVRSYQKERNEALRAIAEQRSNAREKMVQVLKPILSDYSKENSVSIIINKKTALYTDPSLDITKPIIELLNKKLPSLNLK